ncbi:MAG: hypothetical protein Q9160_008415 [Pyrenula sp. 1 TL-2023]
MGPSHPADVWTFLDFLLDILVPPQSSDGLIIGAWKIRCLTYFESAIGIGGLIEPLELPEIRVPPQNDREAPGLIPPHQQGVPEQPPAQVQPNHELPENHQNEQQDDHAMLFGQLDQPLLPPPPTPQENTVNTQNSSPVQRPPTPERHDRRGSTEKW